MRLDAAELRRAVPVGKVLTLAPAVVVEAGLQIYPHFATGPFAWRIAPFVARARRADLRLVGPEDLESLLAADPPAAVMTGYEKRWEKPLAQFAKSRGYTRTRFGESKFLWIAPSPALEASRDVRTAEPDR
jgi:hypothetical protein